MPSEVTCHLAKRGEVAADWKSALAKCFGDRIREVEPMSDVDLATATAENATQSTAPGLMLEDYAVRYRQRFQDGLWMEGIKGAIALMLLSLVAYFGYAQYLGSKLDGLVKDERVKGRAYTNALASKARIETLEKRKALKSAALDSWYEVTKILPKELSFKNIDFEWVPSLDGKSGRELTLTGEAVSGADESVLNYQRALTRLESAEGQPLFSSVSNERFQADRKTGKISWTLKCEFDAE